VVPFGPFDDLPAEAGRVFVSAIPRATELERWTSGRDVSTFHDGHHVIVRDEAGGRVILDGRSWFGESFDPEIAERAWRWLEARLRREWKDDGVALLDTPGTTGRDLWLRTPAADGCPTVSPAVGDLIRSSSGQGRIETRPAASALLPGLYEYDLRLAYVACLRGLPVGNPEHYHGGAGAELLERVIRSRSRALVRFRVPSGWRHIGLLGIKSGDGWGWPTECGRWHGPTWADGCELELAARHGWEIIVEDCLVWHETGEPLRCWADRLVRIIGEAERVLSPEGFRTVRAMIRAVLLHTVGAFHGKPQRVTRTAANLSDAPIGAEMLRPHADGSVSWREERRAAWPEAVHPEWSSHIWARNRRRLLQTPAGGGALTIDPATIVAIRTDAIYTTRPTGWDAGDDGKPGRWVLKYSSELRRPWPRTGDDVLELKNGTR
jgi:hypothetical protein